MTQEEIWKPVVGFECLYEISNYGRVRSLDRKVCDKNGVYITKKGRVIKPFLIKQGYLRVPLSKHNKRKGYLVHRLVAKAFIPNPNKYPIINHKDENTSNNNAENLEWCTYKYNTHYNGVLARKKTNARAVRQYTTSGTFVAEYKSIKDACIATGAFTSPIICCCKGNPKYSVVAGFKWRYADEQK